MKSSIEHEGATRRKLSIQVEADELKPLYDTTIKRLSRELKIPGFRMGKVPKAVLESKLGQETIREEVLKDALPVLYARAAQNESLRAITYPDIEVTEYTQGDALSFTAVVEVRPEIELPDYKGIEVQKPSAQPTEEEIEEQIQRLLERYATLETIGRPSASGDFATIDLRATRHTEEVEDARADGLLYEIGSQALVPELDKELEGKRPGDILKVTGKLPESFGPPHGGEDVTYQVIVKEVQSRKLPALDDEFAKTASQFDTLDELRKEIAERLEELKEGQSDLEVRNLIVQELIERTNVDLPASMVAAETESRLARLVRDLERAQISLESYLEANQKSEEEIVEAYKASAEKGVAAELILDAIAEAEGLDVTPEDIEAEIVSIAEQLDKDPVELAKELEESGRVGVLAGDILKRKTLEVLVAEAKVTTES